MIRRTSGPIPALLLSLLAWLVLPGAAQAQTTPPGECVPQRLRELELLITEGEDFLGQKLAADALESAMTAEAMLPCVSDVVPDSDLGALFRLKGAVLLTMGGKTRRVEALASMEQAFLLNPGLTCDGPGLTSTIKADCQRSATNVRNRLPAEFTLTAYHMGVKLYLDGEKLEPTSPTEIQLNLKPGSHFLQVQTATGWVNQMVAVPAGGGTFNLTPLVGEAPAEEVRREKGAIKLQGLPRDASVTLDGRDRRDLPILGQIDAGDHYLRIASPTQGVYGVTVTVEAGQEVVHQVDFGNTSPSTARQDRQPRNDREEKPPRQQPAPREEEVSGGGGGGARLAGLGLVGVGGISALGSAGTLVLAKGRYAAANDTFETQYLAATSSQDAASFYDEAEALQLEGNRFQTLGWGLGGLAVVAGGAGAFLLTRGGGGDDLGRVELQVLPLATADGGGLLLSGRF